MSANLKCEDISAALATIPVCEATDSGLRFTTHCLYPSFEPVAVYVVRIGDGVVVHDGAGAARVGWLHGKDHNVIGRALAREAALHHLTVKDETLSVKIDSDEWLAQAILAVANASASAARVAVEAAQQALENTLRDIIRGVLISTVRPEIIADGFDLRGQSGKNHHFDFGVREPHGVTLIDAVTPHHVSIAVKYVAFSDTKGLSEDIRGRFIVHDKPLDAEDVSLLTQCADVVPVASLKPKFTEYFVRL